MGNCLKSPTSDDISLLHESQSDRASYGDGAEPDQEPPPPYQVGEGAGSAAVRRAEAGGGRRRERSGAGRAAGPRGEAEERGAGGRGAGLGDRPLALRAGPGAAADSSRLPPSTPLPPRRRSCAGRPPEPLPFPLTRTGGEAALSPLQSHGSGLSADGRRGSRRAASGGPGPAGGGGV